jgi:hypothetical protein
MEEVDDRAITDDEVEENSDGSEVPYDDGAAEDGEVESDDGLPSSREEIEEELESCQLRMVQLHKRKMAHKDKSDSAVLPCSNCNRVGHWSYECFKPCKFCNTPDCNSWKCEKRPAGYGQKKFAAFVPRAGDKAVGSQRIPLKRTKYKLYEMRTQQLFQVTANVAGYLTNRVLLDSGSQKVCGTYKLIEAVEKEIGSALKRFRLKTPIRCEFFDGTTVDCLMVVYIPFLVLHRKGGRPVTVKNLRVLIMEGTEEELVLSHAFLTEILKINIGEIFQNNIYPDEMDAAALDNSLTGDNVTEI